MKKIILVLAICLSAGNLFAQNATNSAEDKLRSEGDAAMKAKNYALVVTKYSDFLKQTNYEDAGRIFNCAYAAFNIKKYDDAVKFYDMAIKKKYNLANSYVGKAMALRTLDKGEEFIATAKEGLKEIPGEANLEKLVYAYCINKGQTAQQAGKTDVAEGMFKNVLELSNKTYKGNALYSLGVMSYNAGAKILKAAAPLAQSDADKYKAEKAKADTQMAKAKEYLEQAVALNPADANSKKILDAINSMK